VKFSIVMKSPDNVHEASVAAAQRSLDAINGLTARERNDLLECRQQDVLEKLSKWVEFGEYIEVEFDLEAMTARVVEVAK
jgi:hypothetical protein